MAWPREAGLRVQVSRMVQEYISVLQHQDWEWRESSASVLLLHGSQPPCQVVHRISSKQGPNILFWLLQAVSLMCAHPKTYTQLKNYTFKKFTETVVIAYTSPRKLIQTHRCPASQGNSKLFHWMLASVQSSMSGGHIKSLAPVVAPDSCTARWWVGWETCLKAMFTWHYENTLGDTVKMPIKGYGWRRQVTNDWHSSGTTLQACG